MGGLSSEERIILHLERFIRFTDAYDAPFGMCQDGMADELGMLRNNISRTLSKLIEDGVVSERLAHIQGFRRRRKVYALTSKGMTIASTIKSKIMGEPVRFVDSDGIIKEMRCMDVSQRTGLDPFQILEIARKGEVIRCDERKPPLPPGERFVRIVDDMPRCERFFSRGKEIEMIRNSLSRSCVAIHGIPGIGKTTLAVRAIQGLDTHLLWRTVREWDTPRSLLVDLGSFLSRIGRSNLGRVMVKRRVEWGEIFASLTADVSKINERVIVVFDDVDKIWNKEVCTLFRILLDISRRTTLRVITTSRKELDFYTERDTLTSVCDVHLQGLDPEGARMLLSNIPDEMKDGIYEETGGHPLYLELINARGLHEGKKDLHSFISREVFEQLGERELDIINTLAIHRIPVQIDVIGEDAERINALRSLITKSLVMEVQGSAYTLHRVIAQGAIERLGKDTICALHRSAAEYYDKKIRSGEVTPEFVIERAYHLVESGEYAEGVRGLVPFARELFELGYSDLGDIIGKIPEDTLPPEEYAFVLLLTAYSELDEGDLQGAVKAYTECLTHAEKLWNEEKVASLMEEIADTLESLKNYTESIELHRGAIQRFDRVGNIRGSARSHILLGRALRQAGDPYSAVREYKIAIETLTRINEKPGLSAAWHNLAIAYMDLGELDKASDALKKALSYTTPGTEGEARVHLSFADLYKKIGDDARVLEEIAKARKISIASKNDHLLIECEREIARYHFEKKEWKKGVAVLKGTEGILERKSIPRRVVLGVVEELIEGYYHAGEFNTAKKYIDRALSLVRSDDPVLARLYLQLSEIEEKTGNMEKALEVLKLGEGSAREISGARIAYALRRSELEISLGKLEDALKSAKEGISIASRHGENYALARGHELMGYTYEKMGHPQKALTELEEAINRFEDLNEFDKVNSIQERIRRLKSETRGGV